METITEKDVSELLCENSILEDTGELLHSEFGIVNFPYKFVHVHYVAFPVHSLENSSKITNPCFYSLSFDLL